MAKIFKIKNKGLQGVAGFVVLLLILATASGAFWGIGYALHSSGLSVFEFSIEEGWKAIGNMILTGGWHVIMAALAVCFSAVLFFVAPKQLGNALFNSTGNKKG